MGFDIKIKHLLPREHGAWAMLFIPIFMGLSIVKWSLDIGLMCFLMVLLFIAHHPINTYLKQKRKQKNRNLLLIGAGLYTIILIGGLALLFRYPNKSFILLSSIAMSTFLLHLYFSYNKQELSILNELIGIIGLTVSAPILYLISEHKLDFIAFYLWCINFIYFAATVFYIKLRVRLLPKIKHNLKFTEKLNLGKYALLSLIVPLVYFSVCFKMVIIIPLVPSLIKVIILLTFWTPNRKLQIKHIGYLEVMMSLIFLLVTPIIITSLR